jgi:O-antigen ligase
VTRPEGCASPRCRDGPERVTTTSTDGATRVLLGRVEAVAGLWLVLLPLLRPLVWSGQPTDVPNLFYLVLLAAAITTGLLQRGLVAAPVLAPLSWWQRPSTWGCVFLLFAVWGSVSSPLPAAAWTLTVGWALHLAAPWALWPVIRRRPQLVLAGLLAGLVGECALLVGQVLWERPRLAQQLAGDPALTVERRVAEQYIARVGSWRLEGTFLLANTLASYLLLLLPLTAGIAWRARSSPSALRYGTVLLAVVALVALAMTGSKAGILALVVAVVCVLVVRLRTWRWRAALVLLAVVVLVLTWSVPTLRRAVSDSAGVRLDYWTAAIALVQERPLTGHGLEGFAGQYPRVKPPAGEETILAHQETLQAAVDLGLPAMLVLLSWWAAVLWSLRPAQPLAQTDVAGATRLTVAIGVPALLLFAILAAGALQGNFSAYPGDVPMLWALLFIAGLSVLVHYATRLAVPTPATCWCAVLAVVLHVQADFSLHSMQVVGVLAWVVVLGQALTQPAPSAEVMFASPRRQACFAIAGLLVLAVVTVGIITASTRGEVLERARQTEAIFARVRLADSGRLGDEQREQVLDAFNHAFAQVVVEDRGAALTSEPREALAMATIRRALDASRRFPADHDLVFVAVAIGEHLQALLPQRAEVLTPVLEGLLADWPQDLLVTKALSEHYLRLARRASGDRRHVLARQAQAMAERAVDLYPSHLPLRHSVILAAEITGDQATVTAQRVEIERLTPLVHRDNQLR